VKRTSVILALAVGALTVSPIASADNDGRGEANTFEGSCQFSGELRQRPPLTNTPQARQGVARAVGTCSGTLTDEDGDAQRLESDRARYFATAQGTLSCAGGSAAGEARVSAEEDPVGIAQKCGREGLRRVRIDMDIATTPAITG
jgi:hypothetical protein